MNDAPATARAQGDGAQRLGVGFLLFAAGAATGLAGVAMHGYLWGLLLTIGATAAALWALPGRLGLRGAFAGGWVVIAALALWGRPEGDYAVAANLPGYGFLALAAAVAVSGITTLAGTRSTQTRAPSKG